MVIFNSYVKITGGYPLVNIEKAIENGSFIVDLPIKDVIFHSYVTM